MKTTMRLSFWKAFGIALVLALSGCSFGKTTINKEKYNQVKKVAVIVYTVPEEIRYSDNPKASGSNGLLQAAIQAAAAGKGNRAATIALDNFITTVNQQKLSFRALSVGEMRGNKAFSALYTPPVAEAPKEGVMAYMSFLKGPDKLKGAAPDGLNQFGMPQDWSGGNALQGTKEESNYISEAIKALDVDGAIIIADRGFSFVCEVCAGGTGAGSTGSAFMVALVNKDMDVILSQREWFATTDKQAAMTSYAVNPLQHDSLFAEHGKKTALVFAERLKADLAEVK